MCIRDRGLTLFGRYIGTLKNDGFYFVNPFCSSFNPAASTKLSQSGDVDAGGKKPIVVASAASTAVELPSKKISLKVMTLNNSRQKINDCLGNPVEIGIAVMWRVVDTAKAVSYTHLSPYFFSIFSGMPSTWCRARSELAIMPKP